MAKNAIKPVIVKIKSEDEALQKDLHLYVFNAKEQFLESAELKNGEAKLKTPADSFRGRSQIIIGPGMPKEFKMRKISPVLIKKMGGYQPSIKLDRNNQIAIVGLPKFKFPTWAWCLINGNLSKTFTIDGEDKVLPVCDARVHICEIDRIKWWWPKIPRLVITDLGKRLKEMVLRPEIDIPTIRDPKIAIKKIIRTEIDLEPNVPEGFHRALLLKLPDEVKRGLLSNSEATVHATIYKNFHLLHPYLCLWPWFWPYFYRCTKIATVYSDCNGSFDFNYLNFTQDKDIYIWAEVNINGEWVTVYRPSIPCHTYWNYECGKELNIRITDPRVLPCSCDDELEGELVWFRSVGHYATALHIKQDDTPIALQGANFRNVGCTDIHDAKQINPFGSTLRFKLLFGDGLPKTGITHYRWKKTMVKNATLDLIPSPETTVVSGPVNKYYFVITTDSDGHKHFETKSVTLGAEGNGENIGYRIPAWDIYDDSGVPAAHKALTIQWTSPDFWSAALNTKSPEIADGLWRFDLELLTLDGSGIFQVVDVPKEVFQVSAINNSGESVDAPNKYLNLQPSIPPAPSKARNLEVLLRIDNNNTKADIQDAELAGALSGPCGFLKYNALGNPVKISFEASHPHNFASFVFSVVKGNNTDPINPSINVGHTPKAYVLSSVGGYTLDSSGIFFKNAPVSQLTGACPQAAFAENLWVYSLATDGTERLDEYDDRDTNAFALSNT